MKLLDKEISQPYINEAQQLHIEMPQHHSI